MLKQHTISVDGRDITFEQPIVTARQILKKYGVEHVQCHTLYQKFKGCDFEKIGLDETVDISKDGIEHFTIKGPEVFNYTVNGEPETTDKKELAPNEILRLAAIDPHEFYLEQILHGGHKEIYAFEPHTPIKMLCTGMVFCSAKWLPVVNIEEYGKHCKEVPPARVYEIKIDKQVHKWHDRYILGSQILQLSGRHPANKFDVLKFTNNHPKPQKVKLDEKVDLSEKCLLRFVIQPKTQDDGELRRQFTLPAQDVEFLDRLGFPWETLHAGSYWLLIKGYPVPPGYNVQSADVALMIPPQYDAAQIDMAYFYPQLKKGSGRAITNVSDMQIDSRNFQQWSRHRQANEWVPGVDNIATHLSLVDNWLTNDLNR